MLTTTVSLGRTLALHTYTYILSTAYCMYCTYITYVLVETLS